MVARAQIADTFITLAFGVALILVPDVLLALYGARTDAAGIVLARLLGAFTLGYAGVNWYTSRAVETPMAREIIRAQGIVDVIAVVIGVAATLAGTVNVLGWSLVALFAVLGAIRLYGTMAMPRVATS